MDEENLEGNNGLIEDVHFIVWLSKNKKRIIRRRAEKFSLHRELLNSEIIEF